MSKRGHLAAVKKTAEKGGKLRKILRYIVAPALFAMGVGNGIAAFFYPLSDAGFQNSAVLAILFMVTGIGLRILISEQK